MIILPLPLHYFFSFRNLMAQSVKKENAKKGKEKKLTCDPLGPRLWSHSECPMSCKIIQQLW